MKFFHIADVHLGQRRIKASLGVMTEAGKSGKVFKMLSGRPAEKMSVCFSLQEIYSTDSLC